MGHIQATLCLKPGCLTFWARFAPKRNMDPDVFAHSHRTLRHYKRLRRDESTNKVARQLPGRVVIVVRARTHLKRPVSDFSSRACVTQTTSLAANVRLQRAHKVRHLGLRHNSVLQCGSSCRVRCRSGVPWLRSCGHAIALVEIGVVAQNDAAARSVSERADPSFRVCNPMARADGKLDARFSSASWIALTCAPPWDIDLALKNAYAPARLFPLALQTSKQNLSQSHICSELAGLHRQRASCAVFAKAVPFLAAARRLGFSCCA
jgi:hypothetical protein